MRAVYSLAIALAACTRPSPIVICHNANCAHNDPGNDDTLASLQESFAMTFDGKPVLDGMEVDTFWYAKENRCIFAHDLEGSTAVPVDEAAAFIADHLATTPLVSWNSERFYMLIELKGFVGASFDDRHTPEQFVLHADCALAAAKTIADGAAAGGHPITLGFLAGVPEHLETVSKQPAWVELGMMPGVERMLIGDIFAPYSSIVPELTDFKVPLDAVEYHPDYMTVERKDTYESLGIDLIQWSFVSTEEAFNAIEHWEPKFAISNEALLLRRWIEN